MSGVEDFPAPFILTAELPPDLARWATSLRRTHYPAERNYLDAHVTLFHALPPFCEHEIRNAIADLTSHNPPPAAQLAGVMSLGKGTALRLFSPEMLGVRDQLAECWHGLLTAQDTHIPRLHVTVQNKVATREARALQSELEAQLSPRNFSFPGLALHIYRGGPWEFVKRWSFRGAKGG